MFNKPANTLRSCRKLEELWLTWFDFGTCVLWRSLGKCFDIMAVLYVLLQTWPKCGPPTYFCRPWTFLCYVEKQHISSTKTNLAKNCTYFFSKCIKRTNFFFASQILLFKNQFLSIVRPEMQIFYKFGPRPKKSGHPCSIASNYK